MRSSISREFVFFTLSLFIVSISSLAAGLTDNDYERLVGTWEGKMGIHGQRTSVASNTGKEIEFRLVVENEGTGKFTDNSKGKSWQTDVLIADGAVMLRIAGENRPFTYHRDVDREILTAEFEKKKGGKVKTYKIQLEKQ